MSFRPSGALTLTAASIALMGGLAFAAVESIDAEPSPQVVIPAATQSDDSSHRDAGDDHGDRRGRDGREDDGGRHGADDPASHDAGDDHGGLSGSDGGGSRSSGSGGHGSDD